MQSQVPDPSPPNWLFRATGLILLIGLIGVGFLLTGGSGFLDTLDTEDGVAVKTTTQQNGQVLQLQLASKPGNVSGVYVETALGTQTDLSTTGQMQEFVAVNGTDLTVYAVRDGEERQAQQIPITTGYTPTASVAHDGNGTYERIQAAVNAADEGDVIVVKRGTYREQVVLNRSVTLVGEFGTTVVPADCDAAFVHEAPDATVRYIETATRCR